MRNEKGLINALVVFLVCFLLAVPLAVAQIDSCEGDFDCNNDQDETDAMVFKTDFGRGYFKKPCPAAVIREPRTDYCAKVRTNRGGMINPYRTTDDEGNPNRWIESISHNIPATVIVGQVVNAQIDFSLWTQPEGSYPYIFNDIFADWDPDNRLAGIEYVYHDATSISMPFTFTAPSVPGKYRIRWLFSSTYIPAHSFYCGYDGHWETGANPDYMTSAASWMEVPIEVVQ